MDKQFTIPSKVRYDDRLTMGARMLYGEIVASLSADGVCYEDNSSFMDKYKVTRRAISSWLKELIDSGYVTRSILYKDDTHEIIGRALRLTTIK